MDWFRRADSFFGRIYHHIGTFMGIAIGLFALFISLDVILRLFKIGNLPGLQEIIEYVLFAGVFLAAPWVLRLSSHVRVDLILSNLTAKNAKRLELALNILGLVICLILVWFGWKNLSQAWLFQSMQMKYFNVPEWWLLTVFVVSFLLLALEFLFRIIRGGDAAEALEENKGGV